MEIKLLAGPGGFILSRTHSHGCWLAVSSLCYMDLPPGLIAFKTEFLERRGREDGHSAKEGGLEAILL